MLKLFKLFRGQIQGDMACTLLVHEFHVQSDQRIQNANYMIESDLEYKTGLMSEPSFALQRTLI